MKRLLILPLLLTTAATTPPVKPAATPPAPAQSTTPTPTRFPGLSDAGNAVLAKAQTAPDPQLQALVKQQRAARDQLMTAVMAPVIDVDKVSAALRQQESVQNQMRAHNTDRIVAAARQLPEEDRGTFLRTLVLSKRVPALAPSVAATPNP